MRRQRREHRRADAAAAKTCADSRPASQCQPARLPLAFASDYNRKFPSLRSASAGTGRSSNGRTHGSGPCYRGSNPCLPATKFALCFQWFPAPGDFTLELRKLDHRPDVMVRPFGERVAWLDTCSFTPDQCSRASLATSTRHRTSRRLRLTVCGGRPKARTNERRILSRSPNRDEMIPIVNSYRLAENLPNVVLVTYPDAGHGSLFQYHDSFARHAAAFLSISSESAVY